MGIGLREHIASLVAVFIALAAGILLGVSLSRQEPLESRMANLSRQFESLSRENREVRERAQALERHLRARGEFDAPLLAGMLTGRLTGVPVGLLWVGDFDRVRFEADLGGTLSLAGADVVGSVALAPDFIKRVTEAKEADILGQAASEPRAANKIASAIGSLAASGSWEQLKSPAQMGLLTLSGALLGRPKMVVVVVSLDVEESVAVALMLPRLLEGLQQGVGFILVAEPSNAPMSAVGICRRAGVTTVDNIETIPGQVAMVWALAGRVEGAFGVKDTAQGLLPERG